jgi:antirestriction protein ArdC
MNAQSFAAAVDLAHITTRTDTLAHRISVLFTELDQAVADITTDKQWLDLLKWMRRFHKYSLNNQMLIAAQCPHATQVQGYRSWAKLGRTVRKGERAITITRPIPNTNSEDPDKDTVRFTTCPVFDISQTDGPPSTAHAMPPPVALTGTIEPWITPAITELIQAHGYQITSMPGSSVGEGFTQLSTKTVGIRENLTTIGHASVMLHELAHIEAGHLERTDEYHVGRGGQRGSMETEAEGVSTVVCGVLGIDTLPASVPYVAGWAQNPETVREAAQTIQRVSHVILSSEQFATHLDLGVAGVAA